MTLSTEEQFRAWCASWVSVTETFRSYAIDQAAVVGQFDPVLGAMLEGLEDSKAAVVAYIQRRREQAE